MAEASASTISAIITDTHPSKGKTSDVKDILPSATSSCPTSTITLGPDEQHMSRLCQDMFAKTADFLNGEFEATSEEYQLLERMNRATIAKYGEMKDISTNVSAAVKSLDEKYNSLQPYLEMIDQVEESVTALEQAAYKLDAYSKRLEAKFRQLEKK